MLHTTFNLLRKHEACKEGYAKLAKSLGGVRKYGASKPIPLTDVLDSNGLDDALWCLRATVEPSDALARDFACDCADSVRHLMNDERGGSDHLDAARSAAINAAGNAAMGNAVDAAWSAAWSAVMAAAMDAPRDVASGVARGIAIAALMDTAWGAARDAFAANLRNRLLAHDPDTNPLGLVKTYEAA